MMIILFVISMGIYSLTNTNFKVVGMISESEVENKVVGTTEL